MEELHLSDILSTKMRILFLIESLSKKKGYVEKEELVDEALEVVGSTFKDLKGARQRIHQIIKELDEERKIKFEYKGRKTLLIPNVIIPHKIVNVERIMVKGTMILTLAFAWVVFILSFLIMNFLFIALTFIMAILATANHFNYEKRFVLDMKEKVE